MNHSQHLKAKALGANPDYQHIGFEGGDLDGWGQRRNPHQASVYAWFHEATEECYLADRIEYVEGQGLTLIGKLSDDTP